jgi:hypothetical protein
MTTPASEPRPGRRVLAQIMHDPKAQNPSVANAPTGSVKIGDDGSMAAFVPAHRAMTWHLTDPSGTSVVKERYWLTFQPGEVRVCTSCHGINTTDQAGNPAPTNKPEALRQLLKFWKSSSQPNGSIQFANAVNSVSETAASATISVSRMGNSAGAVSVSYATSDGTAKAGLDYTAASGILNWADGDLSAKTITVPILPNSPTFGNRTVQLALSAPGGGAALGVSAATLTLLESDALPLPGDVNGDGKVNAIDVNTLLRIALGLKEATPIQLIAGDVRPSPGTGGRQYGDGQITVLDVTWALRRVVGVVTDPNN